MPAMRALPSLLTFVVLVLFALYVGRDFLARHPEHAPWTPLDLDAPIGWATAGKIEALKSDLPRCRALLESAGIVTMPPPVLSDAGPGCAIADAVRVDNIGLPLEPGPLTLSCPVAAALVIWTREVVEPAARARLGTNARALTNIGSYNCRRIAGSARMSEHSTANAIDISGVRTGTKDTVTVLADWHRGDDRAAFLRDIRDGACRLFRVVLSPDYNAAHHDHLHIDEGPKSACG